MRSVYPALFLESLEPADRAAAFSMETDRYQYVPLRQLPSFAPDKAEVADERSPIAEGAAQGSGAGILLRQGRSIVGRLPEPVECLPLEQAKRLLGSALTRRLQQAAESEQDLMARLARGHAPDPLVLYVPPRSCLQEPITIKIEGKQTGWALQHLIVIVGARSTLNLQVEQSAESVVSTLWEFALEEEAHVCVKQVDESPEAWAFTAVRSEVKRNGRFDWLGATRGGLSIRWDHRLRLLQEGADGALAGFWNLTPQSQVHAHVRVEHAAPHCTSNQLFKGIVDAGSSSSFEGLIRVDQIAQKTNAYQLNQNLLVDPTARANSKPGLDILADDVRATHGSTTGRLDPEELFYLVSRGISYAVAKKLLVKAFGADLLERLPESWRSRCM